MPTTILHQSELNLIKNALFTGALKPAANRIDLNIALQLLIELKEKNHDEKYAFEAYKAHELGLQYITNDPIDAPPRYRLFLHVKHYNEVMLMSCKDFNDVERYEEIILSHTTLLTYLEQLENIPLTRKRAPLEISCSKYFESHVIKLSLYEPGSLYQAMQELARSALLSYSTFYNKRIAKNFDDRFKYSEETHSNKKNKYTVTVFQFNYDRYISDDHYKIYSAESEEEAKKIAQEDTQKRDAELLNAWRAMKNVPTSLQLVKTLKKVYAVTSDRAAISIMKDFFSQTSDNWARHDLAFITCKKMLNIFALAIKHREYRQYGNRSSKKYALTFLENLECNQNKLESVAIPSNTLAK